jgi:hypothetical protein
MRTNVTALAGALAIAVPGVQADAQTTNAAPAPMQVAPVVAGAIDSNVLRAGTPVALKTREALTTKGKKLRPGTRVQLEVAEPVSLNGAVVIPVGTPAVGEVTDVRNKGMWGKSGRINARVLYATVNGRQIRMTGAFDDKGTTGTGGVVASAVFIPVAGFFVTGTSANIPVGAPVGGFLDEDVPVVMGGTAPQPLVITPTAASATLQR